MVTYFMWSSVHTKKNSHKFLMEKVEELIPKANIICEPSCINTNSYISNFFLYSRIHRLQVFIYSKKIIILFKLSLIFCLRFLGYISALDFQDIMINVKKHLLTHDVKDNLVAVGIIFGKTIVLKILFNAPKGV